jgi:hypothetical protein
MKKLANELNRDFFEKKYKSKKKKTMKKCSTLLAIPVREEDQELEKRSV